VPIPPSSLFFSSVSSSPGELYCSPAASESFPSPPPLFFLRVGYGWPLCDLPPACLTAELRRSRTEYITTRHKPRLAAAPGVDCDSCARTRRYCGTTSPHYPSGVGDWAVGRPSCHCGHHASPPACPAPLLPPRLAPPCQRLGRPLRIGHHRCRRASRESHPPVWW